MKDRFLVRRLKQAIPNSACECFESYHTKLKDAQNECDIALFSFCFYHYTLIEICEIGDDDNYHPIMSVRLDCFDYGS